MMQTTHTAHVARAFSSAHNTYAQHAVLQRDVARWLSEHITTHHIEESIVDIGCGTGFMAECLPEHSLIGLDIAPDLLKQCASHPNVSQTMLADMHALPFAQNSVANVCSSLALQWTEHPTTPLKNIAHILKPNGQCFFTVPLLGSLKEMDYCWQASGQNTAMNPLFSLDDWARWCAQSGLNVISNTQKTFTHYYPTAREAFLSLKRTGAHHRFPLNNDLKKPSYACLKKRILAYDELKTSKGFPLSFNIGLICAQKDSS